MKLSPFLLRLGNFSLPLLLSACLGTTPPARFYLLEPAVESSAPSAGTDAYKPLIALTPVKIPGYLDRSQMVTATAKNAYQIDELNRWAENLEDNMTRVMLQNLTGFMSADVVLASTKRAKRAKLQLLIAILEFHVDAQEQANLVAQWQVSDGGQTVFYRQSSFRLPASRTDVAQQVTALNECFNRLGREIATTIKTVAVD